MRVLPALLLAVLVPAAAQAATFPGGVLDSTGRAVYLGAGNGIVAIDLTGGEVRWRSDEATEPLFVVGDRLYALAATRTGRLFVRGFALTDGGQRVFESDPIELPRWAVPENGPGRSFHFTWKRERNRLDLSWQVAAWASGSPRKQSSGVAHVDLETRKIQQQPGEPAPAPPAPALLERLAVRWQVSEAGQIRAVVAEDHPRSSAYQRVRVLVFRRWDEKTGKQSASVELLSGSDPVLMPDANGQRLWLRDATPSPDNAAKDDRRWRVVEAADGKEAARVPQVPGTTSATIVGNRAYCLTVAAVKTSRDEPARKSRSLVAVDLESGKVLWKRPLQ